MRSGILGINSILLGIFVIGISVIIVLGSFLLAFTEGGQSLSYASFPTLESIQIITTTPKISPTSVFNPTNTATSTSTKLPTLTATITLTASSIPKVCDLPQGWTIYTVQKGDTLRKLAEQFGLTPQQLADANCLIESRLDTGSILLLPPLSPTETPSACGAPSNWVTYLVQPGDTLFSIALRVDSSVSQLRLANCLNSDTIHTGQMLYVPRQPIQPTTPPPTKAPKPPTKTTVPQPTSTPTDSNISYPQPTLAPVSPSP